MLCAVVRNLQDPWRLTSSLQLRPLRYLWSAAGRCSPSSAADSLNCPFKFTPQPLVLLPLVALWWHPNQELLLQHPPQVLYSIYHQLYSIATSRAMLKRAYLRVSSKNTLKTSPAFLSIFSTPSNGSARLGPNEMIKTSFPCSRACLTRRNAEYVARDVPNTRRREQSVIKSSLVVSLDSLEQRDWVVRLISVFGC